MSAINYHKELCHRAGMDTSAVEELVAEVEQLTQTSGDLCECGWRGKRGGECAFCEVERLRAKVQRLESRGIEDMRHKIEEQEREVERLRADLEDARKAAGIMGTATHAHNPRLLVEQIERIKAEAERLRDKLDTATLAARVASEEYTKLEKRIEAALALFHFEVEGTNQEVVDWDDLVKALRGEK